ncbi:MAG TPA: hypothetical protein VNN22_19530 [Verrucomicrobiae bacterium]|nr:hypothetical protein [Verrucomicrobiae bacterium]
MSFVAEINYEVLWQRATAAFVLSPDSVHGPSHWRRVERNGLLLAARSGARIDVVRLFAVFHDSKRLNEFNDPEHGPRGAAFAGQLRNVLFQIDDAGFDLLCEACTVHTALHHSQDATIGACLDADRLDLGRVGITPDPGFMSTEYGRILATPNARS